MGKDSDSRRKSQPAKPCQTGMRLSPQAARLVYAARVAHLATVDSSGNPHVIPICFAFDGRYFYSPIDRKPKRTTKLKRLANIAENRAVALMIDHYEEDWRQLAYCLIRGKTRILLSGKKYHSGIKLLRRKYKQYRSMALDGRPMICIKPNGFSFWCGAN